MVSARVDANRMVEARHNLWSWQKACSVFAIVAPYYFGWGRTTSELNAPTRDPAADALFFRGRDQDAAAAQGYDSLKAKRNTTGLCRAESRWFSGGAAGGDVGGDEDATAARMAASI